jgi:hypothetical protein
LLSNAKTANPKTISHKKIGLILPISLV